MCTSMRILGSARASRAGERALAIANFSMLPSTDDFGEGAEIGTRGRVRSPDPAVHARL